MPLQQVIEWLKASDFEPNPGYLLPDAAAMQRVATYTVPAEFCIKFLTDRRMHLQLPAREDFTDADVTNVIGDIAVGTPYYDAGDDIFAIEPVAPFVAPSPQNVRFVILDAGGAFVAAPPVIDYPALTPPQYIAFDTTGYTYNAAHTFHFYYLPMRGMIRFVVSNPTFETSTMEYVIFEQSVGQFNNHDQFSVEEAIRFAREYLLVDFYQVHIDVRAPYMLDIFTNSYLDLFRLPIVREQIDEDERGILLSRVRTQFDV